LLVHSSVPTSFTVVERRFRMRRFGRIINGSPFSWMAGAGGSALVAGGGFDSSVMNLSSRIQRLEHRRPGRESLAE
jgi:hypothetical protein